MPSSGHLDGICIALFPSYQQFLYGGGWILSDGWMGDWRKRQLTYIQLIDALTSTKIWSGLVCRARLRPEASRIWFLAKTIEFQIKRRDGRIWNIRNSKCGFWKAYDVLNRAANYSQWPEPRQSRRPIIVSAYCWHEHGETLVFRQGSGIPGDPSTIFFDQAMLPEYFKFINLWEYEHWLKRYHLLNWQSRDLCVV